MGFPSSKQISTFLFLTALSTTAFAAPKLRLTTTTVGPISVAQGQNGALQTIGAYNAGDGSLNLSVSSDSPWLAAQLSSNRACSNDPTKLCTGINLVLATANLPKGIVTGTVRVTDPNALDAPQDVTVTVQVGGGVPDSISFYAPPNGSSLKQSIKTSNSIKASAISNPSSGVTMTVVTSGGGSFATSFGFDVVVNAAGSAAEAVYNGTINVSGSTISTDNKNVPVRIQVTKAPIVAPTPASVVFKLANGSAAQAQNVNFINTGMTDLAVTGADPGSTAWLSATVNGTTVAVGADPTGLSNGTYTGTITVASNAANPVTIPVTLVVADPAPAISLYQTLASVANSVPSTDPVALGDVVTVNGEQLTTQSAQAADQTQPLPTSLGGATVYVNDIAAPIIAVSANQIAFQIPYEVNPGDAAVRVDRDGFTGNSLYVSILPAKPRVTTIVNQNGTTVGLAGAGPQAPVSRGDTLTFTGYGFGQTNPSVASGTPAPDGSSLDPATMVNFSSGGLFGANASAAPVSASLVSGAIGVYQITVTVPTNAPVGTNIAATIALPNTPQSNPVYLSIQ